MRAKVILCSSSGHSAIREHLPAIKCALEAAGIQFELFVAKRQGLARQEAVAASFGSCDVVVVAGGDGTVHEVINGLIAGAGDGPTRPLGILPLSTGNKLSQSAGLPQDLGAAAEVIAAGHVRSVDAGRVSFITNRAAFHGPGSWTARFFTNSCDAAIEAVAAMETTGPTGLPEVITARGVTTIDQKRLNSWDMKIAWDAGLYEGPMTLLSVALGPRTCGCRLIAFNTSIYDGFFDFVFASHLQDPEEFQQLTRQSDGAALGHPGLHCGRTTQLHIESRPGTPLCADGEIIAGAASIINYKILPGKICLLAP